MRQRANWDEYFVRIAVEVSTRSTCDRKHVGAVIVRDRNILSTGYNGSIAGMPHCDDVGHMLENGHCVATIHAEANILIWVRDIKVNLFPFHQHDHHYVQNNFLLAML